MDDSVLRGKNDPLSSLSPLSRFEYHRINGEWWPLWNTAMMGFWYHMSGGKISSTSCFRVIHQVPGFWLMANSHENSRILTPGRWVFVGVSVDFDLQEKDTKRKQLMTIDDTWWHLQVQQHYLDLYKLLGSRMACFGHFDVAILAGDVQMPYPAGLYRTSSVNSR